MERGQLVPVSRRDQSSGGGLVCGASHGFASQVREAHVFFRCPPGRDGDGPENRGWEPQGWEVPSRPGWGWRRGGGVVRSWRCWELAPLLWRRSMQCCCGWSTWNCTSVSSVASPGARWSCVGRENRAGRTPLRAPCDGMSQAHLRTCPREALPSGTDEVAWHSGKAH